MEHEDVDTQKQVDEPAESPTGSNLSKLQSFLEAQALAKAKAQAQVQQDQKRKQALKVAEQRKKAQQVSTPTKAVDNQHQSAQQNINKFMHTLSTVTKQMTTVKRELADAKQTNELIARHGLKQSEYGGIVLQAFRTSGETNLDTFIGKAKNGKYRDLFKTSADGDPKDLITPSVSRSNSRLSDTATNEAQEELAQKLFPRDKEKQKAFLKNFKKLRK
jgi:hypothetical protein